MSKYQKSELRDAYIEQMNSFEGHAVTMIVGCQDDIERPEVSKQADDVQCYQDGRVFQTNTGQYLRMMGA